MHFKGKIVQNEEGNPMKERNVVPKSTLHAKRSFKDHPQLNLTHPASGGSREASHNTH